MLFVEALEEIAACEDMEQVDVLVAMYARALKVDRKVAKISDGLEIVLEEMMTPIRVTPKAMSDRNRMQAPNV